MSMFFSRFMNRPGCYRRNQTVRGGMDCMPWRVAHAGPENTHLTTPSSEHKIKISAKSEFKKCDLKQLI